MTSDSTPLDDVPEDARPYVDKLKLAGATPFDYFAAISMLRHLKRGRVAEIIGRSKPYVTTMRNIDNRSIIGTLSAWADGQIPFDVVRTLSKMDMRDQGELFDSYLGDIKDGTRKSRADAKRRLLTTIKELYCA